MIEWIIQLLVEVRVRILMLLRRTPTKEDDEVWIKIRGTGNRYSISNKGQVRRDAYKRRRRNGSLYVLSESALVKPYYVPNRTGLRVKIRYEGNVRVQKHLAYLVANHFLYKPTDAKRLMWIDGNKDNCAVYNLRWK